MAPPVRLSLALLGVAVLGTLCGCGADGLTDMVQVEGKVLYNNVPLAEGQIVYVPKDPNVGRQASGGIQSDGTFELTTIKRGDGVKKGEYVVTVFVYEPHPGEPGRGAGSTESPAVPQRGSKIPERYGVTATSGLSDVVDDSHPGYREFELTD